MAIREIGGGGYPRGAGEVPKPEKVSKQVGENPVVGSMVAAEVDISDEAFKAGARRAAERARSEEIDEELAEEAIGVPDAKEGSGSGYEGGKKKGGERGRIISTEA
ncbi:MAG: hypothetical protein HOE80_01425 [Candidatus Magasanikbacteria bacterium]|jgi:hypothetical protein|nr:hypothetical protein [Candidatus Magasanikbacteria bacterium]MBT4071363.1 hypothetical protein [Candidatus Magasanikbacteria bacterium]